MPWRSTNDACRTHAALLSPLTGSASIPLALWQSAVDRAATSRPAFVWTIEAARLLAGGPPLTPTTYR
jgi:hypothetical protein